MDDVGILLAEIFFFKLASGNILLLWMRIILIYSLFIMNCEIVKSHKLNEWMNS